MAQAALTITGAVIGSYFGPIGTSIGAAIGGAIGGVVDRAIADPIQGPRLQDLNVSSSAYGQPIVRWWGDRRLGGNLIYSTKLQESKKKSGKTGKDVKTVNYKYQASFAYAFGVGPAGGLLKLWLDDKLVWDATGTKEHIEVPNLAFRFYPGSEDQLPDPTMESDLGVGSTPAHRGMCYIMFVEVPLETFGNRIPNCRALIASVASPRGIAVNITVDTVPAGAFNNQMVVDWTRHIGYRIMANPSPANQLVAFDTRTMTDLRDTNVAAIDPFSPGDGITSFTTVAAGLSGPVYVALSALPGVQIAKLDGDSFHLFGTFGTFSGTGIDRISIIPLPKQMCVQQVIGQSSPGIPAVRNLLITCGSLSRVRIIDGDALAYIWGASLPLVGFTPLDDAPAWAYPDLTDDFNICVPGARRFGESDLWFVNGPRTSAASLDIWKVTVGQNAGFIGTSTSGDFSYGLFATLGATDLFAGFTDTAMTFRLANFDPNDGALYLHLTGNGTGGSRLIKWHPDDGVLWSVADAHSPLATTASGQADLTRGSTYGWGRSGTGWQVVEGATGETRFEETVTGANDPSPSSWDASSHSMVTGGSGSNQRVYLERAASAQFPLADIVGDICVAAGLELADIDTDQLIGSVRGYAIGMQTGREAIGPLAAAFDFDAVESDWIIKFVSRGGAIAGTVPYDSFVRDSEAGTPALPLRRVAELELPKRCWVRFTDNDRDQQINVMSWSRSTEPTEVVAARSEETMDLSSLVLTPTEAKDIVRRAIVERWAERVSIDKIKLMPEKMAFEPTDRVTVSLADGSTVSVRIIDTALGADYVTEATGVLEYAFAFVALTGTADGGQGYQGPELEALYASVLLWPELPLLRDADDTGGLTLRQYAAAGSYAGETFLGAGLFYSADATDWTRIVAIINGATWGVALTAMADAPVSPWLTDTTSSVRLAMRNNGEDLESCTREQMLNGTNTAVLFNALNEAEVFQFQTVTANADGTYTLSDLLRGRRGTDWACPGHAAGDYFMMLDTADISAFTLDADDLAVAHYDKLVGRFDSFDVMPAYGRTPAGEAEKPYSPVHVAGARDGSLNLTITWTRRSRIRGALMPYIGTVPLGETTEAYEVDVLDAGVVVRTITGLTAETAAYSAADQTTDFGSAQSSISVQVFQMSSTVGRGHARAATV